MQFFSVFLLTFLLSIFLLVNFSCFCVLKNSIVSSLLLAYYFLKRNFAREILFVFLLEKLMNFVLRKTIIQYIQSTIYYNLANLEFDGVIKICYLVLRKKRFYFFRLLFIFFLLFLGKINYNRIRIVV